MSAYAELHCLSNFSFQRGASSAAELFARAARLGYRALAITDECSLAGIVRAWQAAREHQVQLIVGSEIRLEQGPKLVLLAEDLEATRTSVASSPAAGDKPTRATTGCCAKTCNSRSPACWRSGCRTTMRTSRLPGSANASPAPLAGRRVASRRR